MKPLALRIDGGLGRNIAMTGAITEVAKKREVRVIASRPLVFRGNPYIKSVHGLDDRDLFANVIRGCDYIELEPYTDPDFFNDGVNRLNVAAKQLGLKTVPQPVLYLSEYEKVANCVCSCGCCKPVLFQPFGSSVTDSIGADKSYRSFYVKDAQYIANALTNNGYTVYVVERDNQPKLEGCKQLTTQDMRRLITLASKYPVIGCDSSMHHAAKAFGYPAVVMRAGTDVERYGYSSSVNLREHPMVAHTPMRLPMNSFDLDISNQYTNQFSQEFLDKFIEESLKLCKKFYK